MALLSSHVSSRGWVNTLLDGSLGVKSEGLIDLFLPLASFQNTNLRKVRRGKLNTNSMSVDGFEGLNEKLV